uniref:coiled-coil domain-containing protein 125 isoform X6 n=1 Tax=Halichoerus grypus TaxID=9711 RepID=UPI001658DE62|nr:coiled-coil domain-containing protein 125 isoform X6 [Halichoerus grypus]
MSRVVRPPSEAEVWTWETEDDDMAEGDLGYGLGRRPGGIYEVQVSHLSTSRKRSDGKNFSPPPLPGKGEERSGAIFQYSRHKSLQDTYPAEPRTAHYARQSSSDSNSELSNVELKRRLQDTLEAIFGKATSHTQMMLQKTVEQKRSLEKEINALQWEIEFDQNRFKNIEESWTQKYDSLRGSSQYTVFKTCLVSWGTWMAKLVECLTPDFSSGHDLRVVRLSPVPGSMLSEESA